MRNMGRCSRLIITIRNLYDNTAKIGRKRKPTICKRSVRISFVNQCNDNRYNTRRQKQQYVHIINRRRKKISRRNKI
jgi:hypothetical protein